MRLMLSSSFSNAFLGGLATFAFLGLGSNLVWAAVIAWGCFFHTGGDTRALAITITGNILGILTAWTVGVALPHNHGFHRTPTRCPYETHDTRRPGKLLWCGCDVRVDGSNPGPFGPTVIGKPGKPIDRDAYFDDYRCVAGLCDSEDDHCSCCLDTRS
jgi:hypothetical protein